MITKNQTKSGPEHAIFEVKIRLVAKLNSNIRRGKFYLIKPMFKEIFKNFFAVCKSLKQ